MNVKRPLPQLLLEFPIEEDMSLASFMPFANMREAWEKAAYAFESKGVMGVYGAEGVGKTHLLKAWAERFGGAYVGLERVELQSLPTLPVALDNVHLLADETLASEIRQSLQTNVFYWVNHCMRVGLPVLFSSRKPVSQCALMPELSSRLLTGSQVEIKAPEASDLEVMIVKWSLERQLELDPDVIRFMLNRAERSAGYLRHLLTQIDAYALNHKRKVTKRLVSDVLALMPPVL